MPYRLYSELRMRPFPTFGGIANMVELSPETFRAVQEALGNGLARHRAGDLAGAVTSYQKVLNLHPDQPDALHYMGVALFQGGNARAAIPLLEKAVAGKPDSAEAHNHHGCALLIEARAEDAEAAFRRACALNADHAEAHYNLGAILQSFHRPEEAHVALERAVALVPGQTGWRVKLAEALKDLGDLDGADHHLQVAITANSHPLETYFQRSRVRELAGQGDLAVRDLKRCAVLNPAAFQSLNNLSRSFMTAMQAARAARIMEWAAVLAPADPAIRYNLANCLLAAGDLDRGWREYRWRHLKDEVLIDRRGLPPEWDGSAIVDGALLIYQEQGIGDEMRFASCLGDISDMARAPTIVECDKRLVPLFQRSYPLLRFIGKLPRDEGPPTSVDFSELVKAENLSAHCAIGDLPRLTRRTVSTFPAVKSYLIPEGMERALWRKRLDQLGPGLKLGFLWRTGLASKIYAHYFFDILDFREVFALPDVRPINLQYDECEDDLRRAEDELGVLIHRPEGIDLRDDLDNLAALIAELDVVVGPMTSVLSLAGAVGTRCIGMNIGLDWTSLGTDRQPWTPSMTVIHKGSLRLWSDAMRDVAALVADLPASAR